MTDEPALVESLREQVGQALRVVASFDRDGYDAIYVRDDVADRLAERAEAVHEDVVLRGIGRDHLEEVFGAGDLDYTMHRFDEMTAFHFYDGDVTGLFVSVDADCDVGIVEFADACRTCLQP